MSTVTLGKQGEDLAKQYLIKKGYTFITANFRCRVGEIDLIFQDQDTLVFVEVKTRYSYEYGVPEEAVTPRKLKNLIRSAQYFKTLYPKLPDQLHIDVVAIDLTTPTLVVHHLESVTS